MDKYLYKLSSIDKLKGVTPDVVKYEVHINMSREKYSSRKGLIILFDTIDEALQFANKNLNIDDVNSISIKKIGYAYFKQC